MAKNIKVMRPSGLKNVTNTELIAAVIVRQAKGPLLEKETRFYQVEVESWRDENGVLVARRTKPEHQKDSFEVSYDLLLDIEDTEI